MSGVPSFNQKPMLTCLNLHYVTNPIDLIQAMIFSNYIHFNDIIYYNYCCSGAKTDTWRGKSSGSELGVAAC